MILPVFEPASLAEYIKSGAPEPQRPETCPRCGGRHTFWRHDSFERQAFEKELTATVRIQRFLCRNCGLTVSCLFAFLIPYKQATAAVVAEAAFEYGTKRTTYRALAEELDDLDSEAATRPSHTQAFKWIESICSKSEYLLQQIQKEAVMLGGSDLLQNLVGVVCPNARKAHSSEKSKRLNALAEVIHHAHQLLGARLFELQSYFLRGVESLQAIFCDRVIGLLAPHRTKHVIW